MSSSRFDALSDWAARRHHLPPERLALTPAGGDASFRRYFRLSLPSGESRMLMDAPPAQEDSRPFLDIARHWAAQGLAVPEIHDHDLEQGFLELDDLGDTPLQLTFDDAERQSLKRHSQALETLAELQNRAAPTHLPRYDAALLGRELDLFPDWCLAQWLGIAPPPAWPSLRQALIESALDQPYVTVHRDFDAMNLMLHQDRLYMIDFQDAVAGPVTYDLISLLRGRYCRLAADQFQQLVETFHRQALQDERVPATLGFTRFLASADAMAAQRSLKVLGIFCRLTLRDGKTGYLARLPHFLDHLQGSLAGLPGHADFHAWSEHTLRPAIQQRLAREDDA